MPRENTGPVAQPGVVFTRCCPRWKNFDLLGIKATNRLVLAPHGLADRRAARTCAGHERAGIFSENTGRLRSNPVSIRIGRCRGAALTQEGTADERGAARPGLAYGEPPEGKGQ